MRVVLDSNVIIAAFAARGICSEIYRYLIETSEIIVSNQIIRECEKCFIKKIRLPANIVESNIDFIKSSSTILEPIKVKPNTCRDKNDLHVLGVALSGNARFIITGDQDLLIIKKIEGVSIYSPRQFWNYLKLV